MIFWTLIGLLTWHATVRIHAATYDAWIRGELKNYPGRVLFALEAVGILGLISAVVCTLVFAWSCLP